MFIFGLIVGLVVATAILLLIARYKPKWLAKLIKESGEELDEFENRLRGG